MIDNKGSAILGSCGENSNSNVLVLADFVKSTQSNSKGLPRTIRAFERWGDENHHAWPEPLRVAADRALLTLKSMDQPAFAKSEVLQRESAKDLQAFAVAYAEWKR